MFPRFRLLPAGGHPSKREAAGAKVANARAEDPDPFGAEQVALQADIAAVATQPPRGSHDAMAWHSANAAPAHDIADRARRAWMSRGGRDISVGRHPAGRNAPHQGEDASGEGGGGRQCSMSNAQSPKPKAQSPKPKAQSPKPKAQSPKPRMQSELPGRPGYRRP